MRVFGCDPVGRAMEPDMVHKMATDATDRLACYVGTKVHVHEYFRRYLQNQTTARRQRHDSAWTTLQPSHESQTDDDDDALSSPVAPVLLEE